MFTVALIIYLSACKWFISASRSLSSVKNNQKGLVKYFGVVFGSFEIVMSEYLMSFKKGHIFIKYFFLAEILYNYCCLEFISALGIS